MKALNSWFVVLGVLFLFNSFNFGQIRYGTIHYDVKINLSKRFSQNSNAGPGGGRGGFAGGDKKNESNNYLNEKATLYFTDSMSIFVIHPLDEVKEQNKTFLTTTKMDFRNQTISTSINILGSQFYVRDTIPQCVWKFTGKNRDIAGVKCKQATTKLADGTKIYAWFDTAVLPAVGPESYTNLPGAILGLAYEDGSITYFASTISTSFPEEIATAFPNLNPRKVYSREDFIKEFSSKYDKNDRLYQLIQDLIHFF